MKMRDIEIKTDTEKERKSPTLHPEWPNKPGRYHWIRRNKNDNTGMLCTRQSG